MCRGRGPDIPARHRLGQSPEGPAPAGQARLCWQGNRRAWKVTGQVHTNRGLTLRRRPVVPGAGRRQTGRSDMGVPLRVLVTDHPPAHGEHFLDEARDLIATGSSPRARGALHRQCRVHAPTGIIPACAGSTGRPGTGAQRRRDHPRVRGEHQPLASVSIPSAGSSPRARGARPSGLVLVRGGGDHPRVRGEHIDDLVGRAIQKGSSPRARGAQPAGFGDTDRPGIIPACAGSTMPTSQVFGLIRDHPRVRGEHFVQDDEELAFLGSSPRARGAPIPGTSDPAPTGIIPACAGSTYPRHQRSRTHRDHPRVRGEHSRLMGLVRWLLGSSPRARGAPCRRSFAFHPAGIIPACAGSTSGWTSTLTGSGDHPRVRGEHARRLSSSRPPRGSSPRARGAPVVSTRESSSSWIIPACAGSTVGAAWPGR